MDTVLYWWQPWSASCDWSSSPGLFSLDMWPAGTRETEDWCFFGPSVYLFRTSTAIGWSGCSCAHFRMVPLIIRAYTKLEEESQPLQRVRVVINAGNMYKIWEVVMEAAENLMVRDVVMCIFAYCLLVYITAPWHPYAWETLFLPIMPLIVIFQCKKRDNQVKYRFLDSPRPIYCLQGMENLFHWIFDTDGRQFVTVISISLLLMCNRPFGDKLNYQEPFLYAWDAKNFNLQLGATTPRIFFSWSSYWTCFAQYSARSSIFTLWIGSKKWWNFNGLIRSKTFADATLGLGIWFSFVYWRNYSSTRFPVLIVTGRFAPFFLVSSYVDGCL